ncbi:hypothetical protein ACVWZL_001190 [Bradyrhizobium sp. GM2.4]
MHRRQALFGAFGIGSSFGSGSQPLKTAIGALPLVRHGLP